MKHFSLNGTWSLTVGGEAPVQGRIPGSVYSILLENGKMPDPFYGENELAALKIMQPSLRRTKEKLQAHPRAQAGAPELSAPAPRPAPAPDIPPKDPSPSRPETSRIRRSPAARRANWVNGWKS